jgi:hypothetical protein
MFVLIRHVMRTAGDENMNAINSYKCSGYDYNF